VKAAAYNRLLVAAAAVDATDVAIIVAATVAKTIIHYTVYLPIILPDIRMIESRDVSGFRIVFAVFLCFCIRLVIEISVNYHSGTLKNKNHAVTALHCVQILILGTGINFNRDFISKLFTKIV